MRFAVTVLTMSLLLACTSSKSAPDDAAKTGAKTEAKEPTDANAPSEAQPATPEPVKPSEWWCVCYQSDVDGKQQPATACRGREQRCHALERRIAHGGRGLVAGSLTHACRKLVGEHPGDVAGGRDAWQPSKLAGAWASEGACLLPGPPDVVANPEPSAEDEEDILAWLADESFGPLQEGMSADAVVKLLGEPSEKDEIQEEGATGDWVQSWRYPAIGVDIMMSADTETGPQSIRGITISAPCDYATKRGMKIGSSYAEVAKAYADVKDQDRLLDETSGGEDEDDDKRRFVAGSFYGGLIFDFDDEQKVSSIFRGAMAE